jgi:hypothetical protein
MLYYWDGGPGPATDLLRIDVPPNPQRDANGYPRDWFAAKAERRTARSGWIPAPEAQCDIYGTGDYFMVDASKVPEIQQQLRDHAAQFPL